MKRELNKNWNTCKTKLMRELFFRRVFENALNEKEADDYFDSEEDSNYVCGNFIINPDSKRKIYYEYFISALVLTDLIYNTYILFVGDATYLFNYIIAPFFILEIYISSVSAYQNGSVVVKEIKLILLRYLKRDLAIDILGTLPFFLITKELLFFRILRVLKLKVYFGRINHFLYSILVTYLHSRKELLENILKLIQFLILFCLTIHTLACVWVWIGRDGEEDGWIAIKTGLLSNDMSNFDVYIAAIYWVMSTFTTVGYGDFSGNSSQEYIFQMITIFIGIGFFGYIIGNINFLIGQVDSIDELQEEREEINNLWLIKLGRANSSKTLTNDYYDHITSFMTMYWNLDYVNLRQNEFFNQLKPRLQKEIGDICFEPVYNRFEGFFEGLENGFKREIVHNLVFEEFRIFPPYTDTYKDDKRSFADKQFNILL